MAKFFGPIGFAVPTESRPGVWKDRIEERNYRGDVVQLSARWTATQDGTNDNLTMSNKVSIVADPFAQNHLHTIKYVKFTGAYWSVTNVETNRPRLILTIGGVYNGPRADS